jgi:outer membrane cobalamin receptor
MKFFMKLKLLKSLFAALFCISGLAVNGQISINGIVIDKLSKEPLVGAAIFADETNVVTISQIDGSFRLNLPQGTPKVTISLIGFINKEIDLTNSGELGTIELETNALELDGIMVVASYAKDRETPVAVSTVRPEVIMEKLGSKEFPEILRSTPSVYVSKIGGGYGDSRINLRGFDSNNIGILVNGVPVNDMESGKVYWSNWAGLADVTRIMQVQRGMGASKLAISSVGGTINIITKNTDAEKGGSVYSGIGNDGYNKYAFNLSTGLMENGWAVTVSGGTTFGNGYVDGTNFKAYSYFANVSKVLSEKHRLSFQAFGAPQWHNQRAIKHKISTYKNENPDVLPYHVNGKKFNTDYGYRNGKVYGAASGYNEFHKPQMSLNHYWTIDETSTLSTAVYASVGTGGGRRISGSDKYSIQWYNDKPNNADFLTNEGLADFDAAAALNQASDAGSKIIVSNAINNHKWYGLLSTYNKSINKFNITAGVDAKYYIGEHAMEIVDLLGGKYFLDPYNLNRPATSELKVGDRFEYYNEGRVSWVGLFAQTEYVSDNYSAFVTASLASNSYRRKDYFNYSEGNQLSGKTNFLPFSLKAGFNYNLNKQNNVYVNAGYFTRTPYFDFVYKNYTNDTNDDLKMEKAMSGELGYGFTSSIFKINAGVYITNWKDKGYRRTIATQNVNIPGINALHKGLELEMQFNPIPKLFITGMWSLGDWVWQDDVTFKLYDEGQNLLGEYDAYMKNIHVGNSAQHTAFLGINYEVFKSIKIGVDINYFGKNYAEFNPANRTNVADKEIDSWQLPDATILNLNARWNFKIGSLNATLYGNLDNLFNKEYIADADDGSGHDMNTAMVFYGFGRTWTTGIRINF